MAGRSYNATPIHLDLLRPPVQTFLYLWVSSLLYIAYAMYSHSLNDKLHGRLSSAWR